MATAAVVQAQDSKTITKRNDGDKTVMKENNDHVAAHKKIIVHERDLAKI